MDTVDQGNNTPAPATATGPDSLLERMRSILNLGPRASDPSLRQGRRHSDTDRPSVDVALLRSEPTSVLSADGSRWLPAPDEQSERYSLSKTDSQVESVAREPVSPHSCTSATCALQGVFRTTELLEIVLSYLETPDILRVRRTSKIWDATIHQSPQLRLHFFAYSQWGRHGEEYKLLPLSLPGLTIQPGKSIRLGRWVSISFTSEAANRIARNPRPHKRVRSRSIFEGLRGGLGSQAQRAGGTWPESKTTPTIHSSLQYEDLFVSQPPLSGMQAYLMHRRIQDCEHTTKDGQDGDVDDEEEDRPAHLPCAKISCEAGITLGFLAETAQSIMASNDPAPSDMADATVEFKAIMSFTKAKVASKKRSTTRSVVRIS